MQADPKVLHGVIDKLDAELNEIANEAKKKYPKTKEVPFEMILSL